MSDWISLGVLLGGFLVTYRKTYLLVADTDPSEDAEARAVAAVLAFMVSLMWPIAMAGWLVWRLFTPKTQQQREDELREREKAAADRERHIARLERELGIGGD